MKVIPIAKINKIIKLNPVPIWPRLAIPVNIFHRVKLERTLLTLPVIYLE